MTEKEDKPTISALFPLSQLLKSLGQSGDQAQKNVKKWQQVLFGLFSGSLHIGSRTPVADAPPWVTLEVIHGGFATGNLAAAGPLTEYEKSKLKEIEAKSEPGIIDFSPQNHRTARSALNMYFLSDQGLPELTAMLESGCFRVNIPEEGALLIVAWLAQHGESEIAEKLLETITPFFDQLRFYPVPHAFPSRNGTGVYLETAGEAATGLRAKRQKTAILKMNEALTVWTPLYDRAVNLFLETVEGDIPSCEKNGSGELVRNSTGQPVVTGGWPCRNYEGDWSERARQLLTDYANARKNNQLCGKPEDKKENFARLRDYLARAAEDAASLTGRDVGMIRKILASYVASHGAPASPAWQATRAAQVKIAARPLHTDLAKIMAERLENNADDEGVPELKYQVGGLTAAEAASIGTAEGQLLPPAIISRAMRCLEAPLALLIKEKIVQSSESVAVVLPLLTARTRAKAIENWELARVFQADYRAFRRRRSLLLLNLEGQVRFDELPWIKAIEPWIGSDSIARGAAQASLVETTSEIITAFPQTILPNKLVKELRALSQAADLKIPFVEELAADIFMGAFAPSFLYAAQKAAELLQGSLYERYYGIDYGAVLKMQVSTSGQFNTRTVPEFAALCERLAGTDKMSKDKWSAARNGSIIEQAQIVTTHNLAALFTGLQLVETSRIDLTEMSRDCFIWICRTLQIKTYYWRNDLHNIKNAAYAWRQMIFFLSLMDKAKISAFLDWADTHLKEQAADFQEKFAPAMKGLRDAGVFADGGRRFTGWSLEKHWLMPEKQSN